MDDKIKILLVEDEQLNWIIIREHLERYEHIVIDTVETGQAALAKLQAAPAHGYRLVLLDRSLPDMDGIEILRYIKQHLSLVDLPVIFQTARASTQEILQGLTAGAYYYLTKPYDEHTFITIVQTALRDRSRYQDLKKILAQQQKQRKLFANQTRMTFKTLDDVMHFSTLIASQCPNAEKIALGLYELMMNAVEHGNLNIGYANKSDLLEENRWESEIKRRQQLKSNQEKQAEINISYHNNQIEFFISDQGHGFAWQNYLSFDAKRTSHSHGRGIAIASTQCFSSIEYYGKGNEIHVIYQLDNS